MSSSLVSCCVCRQADCLGLQHMRSSLEPVVGHMLCTVHVTSVQKSNLIMEQAAPLTPSPVMHCMCEYFCCQH